LRERTDWKLQERKAYTANGNAGVRIVFQYGDTYRVSEIVFVPVPGKVHLIQLDWGTGSCENILGNDVGRDDWPLYAHILDTFEVVGP